MSQPTLLSIPNPTVVSTEDAVKAVKEYHAREPLDVRLAKFSCAWNDKRLNPSVRDMNFWTLFGVFLLGDSISDLLTIAPELRSSLDSAGLIK